MPIDLNQKIQEFGDNADRVDQWVNDPEKYVDKNGQDVKSIPKLIEELNECIGSSDSCWAGKGSSGYASWNRNNAGRNLD